MKKAFSLLVLCALVIVLLGNAQKANAQTCNPQELRLCVVYLSNGAPPSAACCSKLKAQQPCYCRYTKNPNLGKYLNSPNAAKVATACGLSIPKC